MKYSIEAKSTAIKDPGTSGPGRVYIGTFRTRAQAEDALQALAARPDITYAVIKEHERS